MTAQNGRTTAYDAFDGSVVWSVTTSGTSPTESSPAIDPNREFVYAYGIDGKAHKYNIGNGSEVSAGGWPQIATLKPTVEKGASALAFAVTQGTTYLYVVNDGYVGDGGDYQGHITSIDLTTGTQTVFNTLCSDVTIHMILNGQNGVNGCSSRRNGIWGRPGATYDAGTDRVYITTGNGPFNAHTGGKNWGDSVLALKPDGTGAGGGMPMDSYTPTDLAALESGDVDLGVGLADDPEAAGRQQRAPPRRADRQGLEAAPARSRQDGRHRHGRQRRRRDRRHQRAGQRVVDEDADGDVDRTRRRELGLHRQRQRPVRPESHAEHVHRQAVPAADLADQSSGDLDRSSPTMCSTTSAPARRTCV